MEQARGPHPVDPAGIGGLLPEQGRESGRLQVQVAQGGPVHTCQWETGWVTVWGGKKTSRLVTEVGQVTSTPLCSPGLTCLGGWFQGIYSLAWKYPSLCGSLKTNMGNVRKSFHYLVRCPHRPHRREMKVRAGSGEQRGIHCR